MLHSFGSFVRPIVIYYPKFINIYKDLLHLLSLLFPDVDLLVLFPHFCVKVAIKDVLSMNLFYSFSLYENRRTIIMFWYPV